MFAVSPPAIVLGTRNEGKRRELESLVAPWGLQIVTLKEFPNALEVEETGMTFAENAKLKAVQQARHLQQWVLGEDSGICVDVHRPSIFHVGGRGVQPRDHRCIVGA